MTFLMLNLNFVGIIFDVDVINVYINTDRPAETDGANYLFCLNKHTGC